MGNKWALLIGILVLAFLAAAASASTTMQSGEHPVRLKAGTFYPARGEQPAVAPGLALAGYEPGQRGYYIVQFGGPVRESWKADVTVAGGELLEYIPEYAFKVRMNPAQAARVASQPSVAWVGLFQPAYKLAPELLGDARGVYRVRVEQGVDAGQATAAIARSGARVLERRGNLLLVGAEGDQLTAIAGILDVAWIERFVLPEKHNEYGAGQIVGANTANAAGYNGSTQTAAVSDTGIGGGTAATAHRDIPASRVTAIYNWPGAAGGCFTSVVDDGPQDVDSGHGTHTAASVLGGGGTTGEERGTAPAAKLVFQATENWATVSNFCQIFGGWPPNGYFLTGLPADLRTMYQQAYSAGARIHSNSWGSAQAGVYTADSANTDDFIFNNRDMTITFSAGNSGVDANSNGVVDDDSIGSPATAKNVITVGASENDRGGSYPCDTGLTYPSRDAYQSGQTCGSMGGNQVNFLGTWGQRYPSSFPAQPLSGDVTAGNAHQMASWSSRGPTDDGRIKPDVVAPGTWILSGYSDLYQEGYGDPVNPRNNAYQWDGWGMPMNAFYKFMGGTSMSNPIAAGAAAVVRDYYQNVFVHGASAAQVKATLINSAVDLLDENNDGANDNDFPIPNVHEGWGRVNVANATDGSFQYVDQAVGLTTGGSATFQYTVAAGTPFKVTLVWSDFRSSESASVNLVNDLDLLVTAPGGAMYRGNVFSGGWSQTGGSADRRNNVENVYVQAPAAGTWTVQVSGFNVPSGPQPFALVVDGNLGGTPTPTFTPSPGPSLTPTATATATPTAVPSNTPTATPTHTPTPTPTNTPTGGIVLHVGDLDGMPVINGGRWDALVTITVHNAGESPVSGATVNGSWSGGASGGASCVTNGAGQCTVTKNNLKNNVSEITFTVTGVSLTGATYNPGANHDPDGDSSGTSITVFRDGPPMPTPTPTPTATPGPGVTMHVGDLDGSAVAAPRNRWDASVVITVHTAGDSPVAGATVSGSWDVGGSSSCVTATNGQCTVAKNNIKNSDASATFTVTTISRNAGDTYNSGANHDPDGDSSGTAITVFQP